MLFKTPETTRRYIARLDMGEALIIFALGLWITVTILRTSFFVVSGENIIRLVRYSAVGIAVFAELFTGKHSWKSIFALIPFALLSVGALAGDDKYYIQAFILIYCARNIEFRKLARLCLWVLSILTVFIIVSSLVGIIPDYVEKSGERIRHYLGFRYALFPAELVFAITTLVVYLRGKELRILHALALLVSNAGIFYLTNSRLSFALATLLVLIALFLGRPWQVFARTRLAALFAGLSFIWCALLAFYLTYSYAHPTRLLYTINDIFGNRLALGYKNLKEYGIHPIGQPIKLIGNGLSNDGTRNLSGSYNYIDSLYIKMAINYGYIFLIIFLILITLVALRAWKQHDYYLLLVLTVIAGHCLVDDLSFNLEYNPFMLLVGQLAVITSATSSAKSDRLHESKKGLSQ